MENEKEKKENNEKKSWFDKVFENITFFILIYALGAIYLYFNFSSVFSTNDPYIKPIIVLFWIIYVFEKFS